LVFEGGRRDLALIGLQICLLRKGPFHQAVEMFSLLREEFQLGACEVHLDAAFYESACRTWSVEDAATIFSLSEDVADLGLHLPFLDINPLSRNPRIRSASMDVMEESFSFAQRAGAGYVVFHARGAASYPAPEADLEGWRDVVAELAGMAGRYGLDFCLENADDLKEPASAGRVLEGSKEARFCLDVGHLFERRCPASSWLSRLILLNDRFSPVPFAWREGLPLASGGWADVLEAFRDRTRCIHIHNHDGMRAHRPLLKGKIDLRPLRGLSGLSEDLPVIIEADYTEEGIDTVRADLAYLLELING